MAPTLCTVLTWYMTYTCRYKDRYIYIIYIYSLHTPSPLTKDIKRLEKSHGKYQTKAVYLGLWCPLKRGLGPGIAPASLCVSALNGWLAAECGFRCFLPRNARWFASIGRSDLNPGSTHNKMQIAAGCSPQKLGIPS